MLVPAVMVKAHSDGAGGDASGSGGDGGGGGGCLVAEAVVVAAMAAMVVVAVVAVVGWQPRLWWPWQRWWRRWLWRWEWVVPFGRFHHPAKACAPCACSPMRAEGSLSFLKVPCSQIQ